MLKICAIVQSTSGRCLENASKRNLAISRHPAASSDTNLATKLSDTSGIFVIYCVNFINFLTCVKDVHRLTCSTSFFLETGTCNNHNVVIKYRAEKQTTDLVIFKYVSLLIHFLMNLRSSRSRGSISIMANVDGVILESLMQIG